MIRRRAPTLLLLLAFLWPWAVPGDGKVFPQLGFGRAETPAQRALIHWADGLETLVVETTARTDATNLAWIIPLPAVPTTVRAVEPGLFPTLQTLFRPQVDRQTSWSWVGGLVVGSLVLLFRWQAQRKLPARALDYVLVVFVALVFASMLLPSLAKAKGGGSDTGETSLQLLARQQAGVYDVTTLTARQANDLVDWLGTHRFDSSSNLVPVVADYLAHGWVFVAARVTKPQADDFVSLHPLAFTFPSLQPVYPMKLTGLDTDSLTCDLYVFGPSRAAAEGWKPTYCAQPSYSTNQGAGLRRPGLRVRHRELAGLTGRAPVATKLSATLDRRRMRHDVRLTWEPYFAFGQSSYTPKAALTRAASAAAWLMALGLLLGSAFTSSAGRPAWLNPVDRCTLCLAPIVGLLVLAGMPRTPDTSVQNVRRWPLHHGKSQLLTHATWAEDLPEIQAALSRGEPPTGTNLSGARRALGEWVRTNTMALDGRDASSWRTNVFSGERLRLEDSPGNLTLESSAAGLELVWHDLDGYPAARQTIERPTPMPPDALPR